jgi:UDP-N-acetylmuramate-alanine ligase
MNDLFVASGINSAYISSFDDIAVYLKSHIQPGDIVLLLGAGTINKLAEKII